jgi:hypothetical protein
VDLAGKLEDFEFRAAYTIVQHLQFFEKKSEKSKRNPKHILQTRLKILSVTNPRAMNLPNFI